MPKFLGKGQIAICQRSGIKCKASELVNDGRDPQLRVLPEWADPAQPQERPYIPDDLEGVPHFKPSPDNVGVVAPVLSVIANYVQDALLLSWTAAERDAGPRIESYRVYRSVGDGFVVLDTITLEYDMFGTILGPALTYTDEDVVAGDTYVYKVIAFTGNGLPVASNVISVVMPEPAVNPVLSATLASLSTVNVTWTALGNATASSYELYRAPLAGTFTLIHTGLDLSYVDTPPGAGTWEYYVVAFRDDFEYPSNEDTALITASPAHTEQFSAPILTGDTTLTWDPAVFGGPTDAIVLIQAYTGTLVDLIGVATFGAAGAAAISNEQSIFGDYSLKIPGTTEQTDFLSIFHHELVGQDTYMQFPTEFTMEGWFYFNVLKPNTNIFGTNFGAGSDGLVLSTLGKLSAEFDTPPSGFSSANGVVTTGVWTHIAYTRDASSVCRIFVNGVVVASATNAAPYTSGVADGSGGTYGINAVGYGNFGGPKDMNGYVEQIVYSKTCYYTGAFTPPLAPYGGDAEHYAVYRDNLLLAIVDADDGLTYHDTTGVPGQTYFYTVYAYDDDTGFLVSSPSNVLVVTTP